MEPLWKAIDGLMTINSVDDLVGIATAIGNYVSSQYAKEFSLIQQIQASESIEAVKNINWDNS